MVTKPQAPHPYVVRTPDVCGGAARLDGTRFPVRSVVVYVLQQGLTPEQLSEEWPGISLAAIYDALSYYYDHREEVDRDIDENRETYWRERLGPTWSPSASTSTKT
jgi:uncharacterized protein (DUF433 family)